MYVFAEKNDKYLSDISKILDIMNSNSELFLKSELENTIKLLSDSMFSDIKKSYKKPINLFKKKSHKLETSNICAAFNLKDSTKFKVTVDVENSVYALNENDSERVITFVEMTHQGKQSIDYYYSVIRSVNPSVIVLEQEPIQEFVLKKSENANEIRYENLLKQSIDSILKEEIQDKVGFILKDKNVYDIRDRYVYRRSKGMQNNVIKKGEFILIENESILNYLKTNIPSNLKKIIFNDLSIAEYINSFISGEYKIEEKYLKDLVILLNELEIAQWLLLQEKFGCRLCASFFNKQRVEWQPLCTEYLIDKTFLNNYDYTLNTQVNNIIKEYINKENGNIVVFSSDSLTLCRGFIERIENDKYLNNLPCKETENLYNNVIITNENSKKIALSLLFKENFNNYFFSLPFQTTITKLKVLENFFQTYYKTGKDISYLKNTSILKTAGIDWKNSGCHPLQYVRNNFVVLEKMDSFLREREYLI